MAQIDPRKSLPLHVTWLLGAAIAWLSWQVAADTRLGVDSHAYWAVWQGDWRTDIYDIAPGYIDAYNYSPAFALALWPISHLPWPVFGVLWAVVTTTACVWLLRPLGWRWVAPLLLCASPEIMSGNIFWLLALTTVWGLGGTPVSGAWWAVSALTKVTVALGPVWFAVRREWRPACWSGLATGSIILITWLFVPDLWRQWATFLVENEASSTTIGSSILPPLVWRLPIAVLATGWGATTNRKWALPVAMVLATPVAGPAALVILAAIPRLIDQDSLDQ